MMERSEGGPCYLVRGKINEDGSLKDIEPFSWEDLDFGAGDIEAEEPEERDGSTGDNVAKLVQEGNAGKLAQDTKAPKKRRPLSVPSANGLLHIVQGDAFRTLFSRGQPSWRKNLTAITLGSIALGFGVMVLVAWSIAKQN